jgi:hypothetical protein
MRKTLRIRFEKMIFFTKIKVITEPFPKVIMLVLWNSLMNEKWIKLHRNVLWNMQTKPLVEYQGKG